MWTSSIQHNPTKLQWLTYSRSLYDAYMPTLKRADAFHCRMVHWNSFYSCIVYSSHSRPRWKSQVLILLLSTCIARHRMDLIENAHNCTNRRFFLFRDKYELGKYQHKLAYLLVCIFLPRMAYFPSKVQFSIRGNQSHHPLILCLLGLVASRELVLV